MNTTLLADETTLPLPAERPSVCKMQYRLPYQTTLHTCGQPSAKGHGLCEKHLAWAENHNRT